MAFISSSLQWCKGEIFEGRLSLLFGICVCLLAFIYWKTGSTAFAKAIFLPFLPFGFLASGTGLGLMFTDEKRTNDYQQVFTASPREFLASEKPRTEGFIKAIHISYCPIRHVGFNDYRPRPVSFSTHHQRQSCRPGDYFTGLFNIISRPLFREAHPPLPCTDYDRTRTRLALFTERFHCHIRLTNPAYHAVLIVKYGLDHGDTIRLRPGMSVNGNPLIHWHTV